MLTHPLHILSLGFGSGLSPIAPGTFRTPAYNQMPDEMVQHLESMTPFPKRMGRPDEYAALVEHICTNSMLNGEVIRIDGAVPNVKPNWDRPRNGTTQPFDGFHLATRPKVLE